MKNIIFPFIALTLISCQPQETGNVSVTTSGVVAPFHMTLNDVTVSHDKFYDLGEHIITDGAIAHTLKITNNTSFPITDVTVTIVPEPEKGAIGTFKASEDGGLRFPGEGGTCNTTIAPKETCIVQLEVFPRVSGILKESIQVDFKNKVGPETHKFTYQYLSGTPASLIFKDDINQYTFGELVGLLKVPVLERSEGTEYQKEVEISNAGELSARDIKVSLNQTCLSKVTNSCPAAMNTAYKIEHNCPSKLNFGEKCNATIFFEPQNRDLPDGSEPDSEIKQLSYTGILRLNYIKDPKNSRQDLNGYFKTTSTRVEANFITTNLSIVFDDAIYSGNRAERTFKINNSGWRPGIIKQLIIRDPMGGAVMAKCGKGTGDMLSCYSALDLPLSLAEFPFNFKDRNGCISEDKEVPVGEGCIYDVYFQPSTTLLTAKSFELPIDVKFDSQWKGLETLKTLFLTTLEANSLPEAQLKVESVKLATASLPSLPIDLSGTTAPDIDTANQRAYFRTLGRMALLSGSKYKRKTLEIVLKNLGRHKADNIVITDGKGTEIKIAPNTASLGLYPPYDYIKAEATSSCFSMEQNQSCTIKMEFAPLARDSGDSVVDEQQENDNLFDTIVSPLPYENYVDPYPAIKTKKFFVKYDGGAQFSDDNLVSSTPDFKTIPTEIYVSADPARIGLIQALKDNERNLENLKEMRVGDKARFFVFISNVGSGPVDKLKSLETLPIDDPMVENEKFTIVDATPYLASLNADSDCTSHLNQAMSAPLAKNKTCILAIEYDTPQGLKKDRVLGLSGEEKRKQEFLRLWSRELQDESTGDDKALQDWAHLDANAMPAFDITLSYFDGDINKPAATRTLNFNSTDGDKTTLDKFTTKISFLDQSKIFLGSINPWYSATVFRPFFAVPDYIGTPSIDAYNSNETWFFGNDPTPYSDPDDSAIDLAKKDLLLGRLSSNILQSSQNEYYESQFDNFVTTSDYVYYLGSFPVIDTIRSFNFSLKNFTDTGSITDLSVSYSSKLTITKVGTSTPLSVTSDATVLLQNGQSLDGTIKFDTDGEDGSDWYHLTLTYKYLTGLNTDRLLYTAVDTEGKAIDTPYNIGSSPIVHSKKITFLAHLERNPAKLNIDIGNYTITSSGDSAVAPIVSDPDTYTEIPSPIWTYLDDTIATGSGIILESQKILTTASVGDVFAKTSVKITNTNSYPINFSYFFRTSVSSPTKVTALPSSLTIITNPTESPTPACSGSSTNLGAGQFCYLTLKYLPRSTDDVVNYALSLVYNAKSGTQRKLIQNIPLQLKPVSPATISFLTGCTMETIKYGAANVNSCKITSAASYNIDSIPKNIFFNTPTTRIKVSATSTTKASFLKSYHDLNQIPANQKFVVPAANEYDANGYVKIAEINYDNNPSTPRMVVKANKGCLFGDDENNASIVWFKKGFNSSSTNTCYLEVYFYINFRYLNLTLSKTNVSHMMENAKPLSFYNFQRTGSDTTMVHLISSFVPDISKKVNTSDYITNIGATTNGITFDFPELQATNPGVGNVVGYRVLISEISTDLSSAPYTHTNYIDIDGEDNLSYSKTGGLTPGKVYSLRLMAIREHPERNKASDIAGAGLPLGKYLSPFGTLSASLVRVVIPPAGVKYLHGNGLVPTSETFFVENATTAVNVNHASAVNACKAKSMFISKDGTSTRKEFALISKAAWDMVKTNADLKTKHWSGEAKMTVNNFFGWFYDYGYNPNLSLQTFANPFEDGANFAYFRTGPANVPLPSMLGGHPYNSSLEDYWSLVFPEATANARCMISLYGF